MRGSQPSYNPPPERENWMSGKKVEKPVGRRSARSADKRSAPTGRLRSMVDHQRSEFLRLCRSRIKPEDAGLAAGRRARTGGLRREDVAALSGVSVSWYTWLEQGRDIRVSDEVLERICQTFRLTEDERTYLFSLVQHRMPRVHPLNKAEAPPDLVRMLQSVSVPAIAMNLRWDILAWNALNTAIYRDYGIFPASERNLLELIFTRPIRHMTAAQQEAMAHRLCARVRYDYSQDPDDPKFEAMVRRLCASSPLFNRFWRGSDFTLRSYGMHHFNHPRFGLLSFEHTSYVPDGHPNIRVTLCAPENAAARKAVAVSLAEQG
jgi:transcriptional regulator with XRE-family HTH domain